MLEKMQGRIDLLMKERSLRDDDEVYLFMTMEMALGFGALLHLGLVIIYIFSWAGAMAWINALCTALMCVGLVQVHNRRYYASGAIMVVTLVGYSLAAPFLSGFGHYNILYLVLGMVCILVLPFAPPAHRAVPGVLIVAGAIIDTVIGENWGAPLYPMRPGSSMALSIYNVCIGFLGLVLLLAVASAIKSVLAHHTEDQLGDMIHKANSDTLTGLYNRRYAHIYFDNLMHTTAGEIWCVAMLDVDNFKQLNDEYGHLAGDKVLSTLADMMRQVLRSTDNIFRWGGEEFLLVLKGTSLKNATMVLERMLKTIEDTDIEAEGHTLHVTATVGVTVLDIRNIQASIDKCDARLYIGKRNGKNQVVSTG